MGREDEGVLLVDLARCRKLDPRDVIVRLLDRGSHARPLRGGFSRGQVPRGELEPVSAAKHGGPDRDAGRRAEIPMLVEQKHEAAIDAQPLGDARVAASRIRASECACSTM
jgi:hypothetical protein